MKFKPRKGTHRVKELRFAAEKVTMETHTPDQTPQSVAQPQDTVTTVATPLKEIFIGRQPIYNANLGVHAYELLFRADNITIQDMDKDVATAEVVLHAFFEFGIEKLVGGRHVTVNVTERFLKRLMDVHTLPIPPEFLILDIPPDMNPNEEMMNLLRDLVSKGITLALDDFLYRKQADELLGLAKQVKFEVGELTEKQLKILISKFKKIDVPIVAKRVENLEEYMRLRDLGIDYFQGNLLGSPRVFKTKTLPPDRLSVIRLLSTLMDASTETEQINEVLSQNVQLSYKLLKVINSAFYGLPKKVESIHHAIVTLGRNKLTTWASVLAISNLANRPPEFIRIALTRAKTCELLAAKAGHKPVENFFTVGMLSALDILMEVPLQQVIDPLPLTTEVKQALLARMGVLGRALESAIAYEEARFDESMFEQLEKSEVIDANLKAIEWANDVVGVL